MSQFVQLSKEDCQYLLNLIQVMDMETKYTEKQRGYTIPKLEQIAKDPRSKRLAFQDTEYLLDLIEDDERPSLEQQRAMTQQALIEIQNLQAAKFEETRDIEQQRAARRARCAPLESLQEKFQHTH